jgi:hypothetical protein
VDTDEHMYHRPECSLMQGELRRRQRRRAKGSLFGQVLHVWLTQPTGVDVAEAVAMPLSPKVLLVFGGIGEHLQPKVFLTGNEPYGLPMVSTLC